jgi:hypothetical protein
MLGGWLSVAVFALLGLGLCWVVDDETRERKVLAEYVRTGKVAEGFYIADGLTGRVHCAHASGIAGTAEDTLCRACGERIDRRHGGVEEAVDVPHGPAGPTFVARPLGRGPRRVWV